ncbi:hypothetical protein N7491_004138 [Penicillium cf. griseofulvum]|uniref:Uncharacterized protein n=1 Tax=Penicillium cf. griseofulvum TaxID=2972120 RepID=A0A9W9MPT3_9EURO|nr:hypothetical protein N7472_001686 [Penicillium cf. griseofulvum]KAJ5437585.1 hypothetical protein N7445_006129 [Penicillium cf. griseofulvum]KAJ5441732.1 hypothetical protein N7491_004138 [Penicillium cf. griseofulvum]
MPHKVVSVTVRGRKGKEEVHRTMRSVVDTLWMVIPSIELGKRASAANSIESGTLETARLILWSSQIFKVLLEVRERLRSEERREGRDVR